jgi:predicted  nucleic acid-binding Zn-ribbon protein
VRERGASERAAAEARKQSEEARARHDALGADARAAREALEAELAREREASADLNRAIADIRSQLQAERASNRDLRLAVESTEQRLRSVERAKVQAVSNHDRLAGELDDQRTETARASKGMVDAQLELESARAEIPALRADLEAARARLEALATERDTIAGELQAARKWIDALREAEAEFGALSSQIETPSGPPPAPPAKLDVKAPAPSGGPEDDEGWQAVRLANRYVFREEIAVQINGEVGRLFDLSASGCQLLSPSALKPNHVVKVVLPSVHASITCTGKVVWTRLEPSESGRPLGYRAGVRFTKADESAIETFAADHGATE